MTHNNVDEREKLCKQLEKDLHPALKSTHNSSEEGHNPECSIKHIPIDLASCTCHMTHNTREGIEEVIKEFMSEVGICTHKGLHIETTCTGLIHLASGDIPKLEEVIRTTLHQELQKARAEAYKDGARDVRDFAINELMKRAGQLRDDLNIFTFDQIQSELDKPTV